MIRSAYLFVVIPGLLIFQSAFCHAAGCGLKEYNELAFYSDRAIHKRDIVAKMAKDSGISNERKAMILIMYGEAHSLYLIISHMKDLICMYCNTLKCKSIDVQQITRLFEVADIGFSGKQYYLLELKSVLEESGHGDLAKICVELSDVAAESSMLSSRFYGKLYELRGEPTPPSP